MRKEAVVCRICSKKRTCFLEMEKTLQKNSQLTLLDVFNRCTHLNASVDDGLPERFCIDCCDELEKIYGFIERAEDSDHKFRRSLIKNEKNHSNTLPISQNNLETICDIKPEFISCSKDPLESDSEDEIEMNLLMGENNDIGLDISKSDDNYNTDDEDDKPLYELVKKVATSKNVDPRTGTSSDIEDNSSEYGAAFNDEKNKPDPAAQIFPQGKYSCKICRMTYFTATGLKSHILLHMPKSKKEKRKRAPNKNKILNSKTNEKDKNKKTLNNIQDEKEEEKEQNENKVQGASEDKTTIDHKTKRKSKPPKPKKMFPCHVCGKHMISASKLRYHMVMHTGEKDYLCTMCPKAYSTIYALKHHLRTHTGERPYECKYCGDKFTRPTTLKSHLRRHTGERPYSCDICGKRFIQHSSMTTHMKLNHMAKTISCPHCDKKYARQTDLNTHLLSHTGDKPFSCQLCSSRFIRQANLNKHMNQHHLKKINMEKCLDAGKTALLMTDNPESKQMKGNETIIQNQSVNLCNSLQPLASKGPLSMPRENISNFSPDQQNIRANVIEQMQNEGEIKTIQDQHHKPMQVESLTNVLAQPDVERIGRSVEDILRWGWPHPT